MTGTMEDRNHQCTCKTDQASTVLLKILSLLQAVEMLELFSFLQQTPWSPVRDDAGKLVVLFHQHLLRKDWQQHPTPYKESPK